MLFSPANIQEMIARAKTMTPIEIILAILTGLFWTTYGFGFFVLKTFTWSYGIMLSMMRGSDHEQAKKPSEEEEAKAAKKVPIGNAGAFSHIFFRILPLFPKSFR